MRQYQSNKQMKKVLVIKHVEFEGPGRFLEIFSELAYTVDVCSAWKDDFPALQNYDLILLMGGSMSVNDTDKCPWLETEKTYIKRALESNIKIVGVCLGAQLIANVLGEGVYLGDEPEIGWFPIELKSKGIMHVLHWHSETFDLPEGAELIASSAVCENQVFTYGKNVLGIQCHLEMDRISLESLMSNCKQELVNSRFVMTETQMLEGFEIYADKAFQILKSFLMPMLEPEMHHENIR